MQVVRQYIDETFLEAFLNVAAANGWDTQILSDGNPNPIHLILSKAHETIPLILHAKPLTPQESDTSDHNRPSGEWHIQLIFDGFMKGKGARNYLEFAEGYRTLLLGYLLLEDTYVIAAFNPAMHRVHGYSSSAQVKIEYITTALQSGFAVQIRRNREAVVFFRLEDLFEYLKSGDALHDITRAELRETVHDEAANDVIRTFARQALEASELPTLLPSVRQRRTAELTNYIRNRQFKRGIINAYQRCAICGFQYDYVLDAAHIVPVAEGGTDTYDNGLGLCPNCHRMFDRGLILVDETGQIHLHPQRAEEYADLGLADSLDNLRQSLRERLWVPVDPRYQPSAENLRRTFEARR